MASEVTGASDKLLHSEAMRCVLNLEATETKRIHGAAIANEFLANAKKMMRNNRMAQLGAEVGSESGQWWKLGETAKQRFWPPKL